MSWQAVRVAKAARTGSVANKAVLLVMAEHAQDDGGGCFAMVKTIAWEAECDARTVHRAQRALEELGLIYRCTSQGRPAWGISMALRLVGGSDSLSDGSDCVSDDGSDCVSDASDSVSPRSDSLPFRSEPPLTTPNPPTRRAPIEPPGFVEFWLAYPRRDGKGAARKAWTTATKSTEGTTIVTAAQTFARQSAGKDPRFIPHPSTWLNQERWSDESLQVRQPKQLISSGAVMDSRW